MTRKRTTILIVGILIGVLAIATMLVAADDDDGYIDLTTLNAIVTHNGAQFVQSGSGAGTGNWNPFLTFNVPGSQPHEKGYNSDGPKQFDEFYGGGRTHPIQLAAIPTVEIDGIVYREFGLDANDSGQDDYMSIDEFKVFVDNQPNLDSYVEGTELFGNDDDANKEKVFDMDLNCGDSPVGCTVFMRSQSLSSGSGVSDIIIRVPDSAFAAYPNCEYGSLTCGQYVYVWSAMGYYIGSDPVAGTQNWDTNAGFEEWQTREAPVVSVTKTADTSYTQDFTWTVDKKVNIDGGLCEDSATADLFTGESQAAKWCIEVTRSIGDQSEQTVFGEITIVNPTGSDVIEDDIDAVITSIADVISSADFTDIPATINCGVSFPYTLDAGDTLVCTYSESTPGADNETTGTNTVTVVVEDAGMDFVATADFDFANTDPSNLTETNATATLTDDEGPLDALFTGSGPTNYVRTYTCDDDEGETSNTAVITPSDGGPTDSDTATLTLNCHQIAVTKDANTSLKRTWNWTIDKSVDPALWQLFTGESGTSQYTVSVDKVGYTDSNWAVNGSITVSNVGNPIPATINSLTDAISGVGAATVDCGAAVFPYVIPAGGTLECPYARGLPNGSNRTNTATATQQLHDYDQYGAATPDGTSTEEGTAGVNFSSPAITEVNASIHVTDTNGGAWGPVSDDASWNYERTFACNADEGTHGNTAEITETGQTATASVDVECYSLSVTKTTDESLTRKYKWMIDKVVDDEGPIPVPPGASVNVNYQVTVDLAGPPVDGNWAVSGNITVSNDGNPIPATINSVTDAITGIGPVTVDCGVTFPQVITAGGSLVCTYSSLLPDDTTRTNTATATQQLYDYDKDKVATPDGTTDHTGDASVDFSGATIDEVDDSVDVTDSFKGFLGTCSAGSAPCTFTYKRTITAPEDFCGLYTVDNTATFTTNDTHTTGSDDASVTIKVPCEGCTPGFWQGGAGAPLWNEFHDQDWKNHNYATTWNPFAHDDLFNDFFDGGAIDPRLAGQTMFQIVSNEGGIANPAERAARDLVAAYLNEAAFPDTFPADSLGDLEDMWYAAVAGGDAGLDAFHNLVSGWNDQEGGYCPLP